MRWNTSIKTKKRQEIHERKPLCAFSPPCLHAQHLHTRTQHWQIRKQEVWQLQGQIHISWVTICHLISESTIPAGVSRLGCAIHHENMPPVLYIHNHPLQRMGEQSATLTFSPSLCVSLSASASLPPRCTQGKGCPVVSCCHLDDIYYGYVKALRVGLPPGTSSRQTQVNFVAVLLSSSAVTLCLLI